MNKFVKVIISCASIVLAATACSSTGTATPTPTPIPPVETVIATGHLVPVRSLYLSFAASGRVEEVLVQMGDNVNQGQVLMKLGDRQQVEAALAGAKAQQVAAQQSYDLLVRTAEIAHAQAWQTYLNAQKARAAAQLAWDKLDKNTIQTDIDNALADVTSRKTDLTNAEADLAKYSNLPANNATRKIYEDKLRTAQTNYDSAVQKAVDLSSRRDTLDANLSGSMAAEAEAKLSFENTLNSPDKDKLALALAQLEAVNSQVAAAQSALDNYDLKAPFDGTVEDTNVSVSQMVGPQNWAVALADTSQWYVDTSDLTETDIVKVSKGQVVKLTADALPGVVMDGAVESISGAPVVQGGDILYTVHILVKNPDPRLLWGMTFEVTFSP